MKRNPWPNVAESTVLSTLLGLCGVGCLATAFGLTVSWTPLVWWCAGLALAASLTMGSFRGLALPVLLALAGGALWKYGPLAESVEGVVYRISDFYNSGYHTGVLYWSDLPPVHADATLCLCAIAALPVVLTACAVRRGKGLAAAIFVSVLPLAVCLGLNNHVPNTLWLFGLLATLVLLLLTRDARRENPRKGTRLSLVLALPVLLGMALLFLLVPRAGYDKQDVADTVFTRLTQKIEAWMGTEQPESPIVMPQIQEERIDLSKTGPRLDGPYYVMEITSDVSGLVYLRQQVYDRYENNTWSFSGEASGLPWPAPALLHQPQRILVRTTYAHPLLYTSYYPGAQDRGNMELPRVNTQDLREYTIPVQSLKADWHNYASFSVITGDFRCLELPEDVRAWAEEVLRAVSPPIEGETGEIYYGDALTSSIYQSPLQYSFSLVHLAENICYYVKNSATYDLRTQRMEGSGDFVRWFLEESDTGYCVHFASAATVLLRAAGIPARYVTGYMVEATAGQPMTVRQRDAHAWVEYWLPGLGWLMMEPTPPDLSEDVPPETEPLEQPETLPRPTQPRPTEPTAPAPEQNPQQGGVDGPENPQAAWKLWLPGVLRGCAMGLAVVIPLLLQWRLRLQLRKRRYRGSPNRQAVGLWRELALQARLLHTTPDARLYPLAEKAQFSQHTLTEAELAALENARQENLRRLKAQNLFRRLVYRLVYAAY